MSVRRLNRPSRNLTGIKVVCTTTTAGVLRLFWMVNLLNVIGIDSRVPTDAATRVPDANDALNNLTEEFWRWRLREYPEYASQFGFLDYVDKYRIADFTEETFVDRKNNATTFLDKANSISLEGLSGQSKLSLKILRDMLQTYIDGFHYRKYCAYNPAHLFSWDWSYLRTSLSRDTVEDYEILLERYNAVPEQIDQMIELMKEAIRLGQTVHRSKVAETLGILDSELQITETSDISEESYSSAFVGPFTYIPFSVPHADRIRLLEDATQTFSNVIKPSLLKLSYFLIKEYLPNSRTDIGLSSLPNGTKLYQQMLKWHLSVDLTPEEIHQQGLEEVERIHKLMTKIIHEHGFEDRHAFMEHIEGNSQNFFTSEVDIVAKCVDIRAKAEKKLPHILRKVPRAGVEIVGHAMPYGPVGYYTEPSQDGSVPGVFSINTIMPRLKMSIVSVTLHESLPGHHTQAAYAIEEDLPLFRRVLDLRQGRLSPFSWPVYTAYAEGWALYAEKLGEDMDMYSEPYELFGRYASEVFRAARLVVDTGIHVFGWTAEEASQYLRNVTLLQETFIKFEVDRSMTTPGQVCAYKIGELKIQALRRKAEQTLGSQFDIRSFHDNILMIGPAPLHVVEEQIEDWLIDQIAHGVRSSSIKYTTSAIVCTLLLLLQVQL